MSNQESYTYIDEQKFDNLLLIKNFINTMFAFSKTIDKDINEMIDNDYRLIYRGKKETIKELYNKVYSHFPELAINTQNLNKVHFKIKLSNGTFTTI